MSNAWSMYVVECADKSLYCGVSTCVDRRVKEHNALKRGSKYTRSRRPVKLVFAKYDLHRGCALKIEYQFKQIKSSEKRKIVYENANIHDYIRIECECYCRGTTPDH